jgi:hypothetical protein
MKQYSGSCRCGQISAEMTADPIWQSYCHCRDCRKQTGAPVMAFVGFRADAVTFRGGLCTWRTGDVERHFCVHCGSQIGYHDDKLPGETYLTLGFMDQPERCAPTMHAFEQRRLPFLIIDDHLPRYEGFSRPRVRQDGT